MLGTRTRPATTTERALIVTSPFPRPTHTSADKSRDKILRLLRTLVNLPNQGIPCRHTLLEAVARAAVPTGRTRANLYILLQFRALGPQKDDLFENRRLAQRHLKVGWWSVFVFATLGLTLESLHGFKVAAYLDVSNETRRLMWTLAHAHGTLLGLIHVAYAVSLPSLASTNQSLISRALTTAGILLPLGFFLGGVQFYAGDPGFGVLLVPRSEERRVGKEWRVVWPLC